MPTPCQIIILVFHTPETPLREAHAKGFLPLGSFAILLTPEGIARIDLSRASRRIRLNHATFREKVGERVHLCTIGGDGRFHLQGQIQALALPAHTALQRPVQDARQLLLLLWVDAHVVLTYGSYASSDHASYLRAASAHIPGNNAG